MYDKIETVRPKGFARCLFVVDLIAAAVVIASGVIGIVYMFVHNYLTTRFFLIVNPIFLTLFGFMMIAAEFKIKFLLKQCHFLTHLLGRGIFFIYLASSVFWYFSFGTPDETLTYVTSMTIFSLGVLYLALHCCGKRYQEPVYLPN